MSVCSLSVPQTRELGEHVLSMIMDSGSEKLVVSFADWRRLGETLSETYSCAHA